MQQQSVCLSVAQYVPPGGPVAVNAAALAAHETNLDEALHEGVCLFVCLHLFS